MEIKGFNWMMIPILRILIILTGSKRHKSDFCLKEFIKMKYKSKIEF